MVKWRDAYEKDLKLMLDKTCEDYGFCDALYCADKLLQRKTITAIEFADFVLISEGMDPTREDRWRDALSRDFVMWFKREIVTATEYPRSDHRL